MLQKVIKHLNEKLNLPNVEMQLKYTHHFALTAYTLHIRSLDSVIIVKLVIIKLLIIVQRAMLWAGIMIRLE